MVGPKMQEVFSMNSSLMQGSSFSPFMFFMVMELGSMVKIKGILGRMLYVDDLPVVAESRQEMQEVLGE